MMAVDGELCWKIYVKWEEGVLFGVFANFTTQLTCWRSLHEYSIERWSRLTQATLRWPTLSQPAPQRG